MADLSGEQIRQIYRGERLHWDAEGSTPITMVGRDSRSGTRAAFEATFLDGNSELGITTDRDRKPRADSAGKPQRCERGQTDDLLVVVAGTPGAIGCAELGVANAAVRAGAALKVVSLNAVAPDDPAARERYPFRAGEYLCTRGAPAEGTLAHSFIRHATGERGLRIIADGGFGN